MCALAYSLSLHYIKFFKIKYQTGQLVHKYNTRQKQNFLGSETAGTFAVFKTRYKYKLI